MVHSRSSRSPLITQHRACDIRGGSPHLPSTFVCFMAMCRATFQAMKTCAAEPCTTWPVSVVRGCRVSKYVGVLASTCDAAESRGDRGIRHELMNRVYHQVASARCRFDAFHCHIFIALRSSSDHAHKRRPVRDVSLAVHGALRSSCPSRETRPEQHGKSGETEPTPCLGSFAAIQMSVVRNCLGVMMKVN